MSIACIPEFKVIIVFARNKASRVLVRLEPVERVDTTVSIRPCRGQSMPKTRILIRRTLHFSALRVIANLLCADVSGYLPKVRYYSRGLREGYTEKVSTIRCLVSGCRHSEHWQFSLYYEPECLTSQGIDTHRRKNGPLYPRISVQPAGEIQTAHLQLPSAPRGVSLQIKTFPFVNSVLFFAGIEHAEPAGRRERRRGRLGNIQEPPVS